jgi:hypothetical protein
VEDEGFYQKEPPKRTPREVLDPEAIMLDVRLRIVVAAKMNNDDFPQVPLFSR